MKIRCKSGPGCLYAPRLKGRQSFGKIEDIRKNFGVNKNGQGSGVRGQGTSIS